MADASIIMSTPTESERKRTRENGDLNFSEMQQPENDFPAPGAVAEDSEERVAKRARFELGSPQNPVLLDDENGNEKRVLESENENGWEKRVLESENENSYEKRVLESENENGNEKRVLESENCVQNEENKVVPDFDVTIIESDDNEEESKEENVAVEVALPKVVTRRAKKSVVDAVVEESQQRRVSPRLQTAERPLYFPRPRIVRAKAKQNENDDDDDDDRNDDDEKQGSRQKSERGPRNGVSQYDGAEPVANGAQEILSGCFDPRAVGLKAQDILSPLAAATSLKPNGKGVTNGEGTIQSSNASSEESSETSDQCVIGLSADDMLTPGAAAISVKTNGVSKHTRHKKANNVNNSASTSPTSNLARARKGAKPVTKCKAALVAGQSVEVGESEEALAHPSDLNDAFWTQSLGVSDSHETLGISPDARVRDTLRKYNAYYLQFVKEEEDRCKREKPNGGKGSKKEIKEKDQKGSKNSKSGKGGNGSNGMKEEKNSARRPDLKAISKMLTTNGILFPTKRPGHIPGVNVGDHFFSRCEMIAIGFHSHWLNGIDYMGKSFEKMEEYKGYRFPLAVAIVLSGQYEDDVDNAENVVYTGQGGHDLLGKKHQIKDQEMSRGNLALKNCIYQKTPVRVIRGHDSKNSYTGKVYTYDGLYQVVKYWAEKGLSGFTVFKYRLRRLAGQPVLTTNQVRFSRGQIPQSTSELRGLVCKDISNGQERIPVVASNVVDDPPVQPTGFTYIKSIKVAKGIDLPPPANGCECRGECFDPRKCACARLNGMEFPYVHRDGGRLVEAKDVVYECGPNCGCGPNCINRASQHGLKYRLEVFRTPNKGWAVRSWDSIPSGALVCEYTGILMRTDELDKTSTDNSFIFEIDCLQTMEGIDGRQRRLGELSKHKDIQMDKLDDKKDGQPEFGIDAGTSGGVARFINHSCDPNLFVQCVLSSHHDVRLARVLLVASDNIPPLQELTYDYGYVLDSVADGEGRIKQMPCYCGAIDCRKRLY